MPWGEKALKKREREGETYKVIQQPGITRILLLRRPQPINRVSFIPTHIPPRVAIEVAADGFSPGIIVAQVAGVLGPPAYEFEYRYSAR